MLIAAAEAEGFSILITGDKNLRFQQNLAARALTVIVISDIHWTTVQANLDLVISAIDNASPSTVSFVEFPRRRLRRRPAPRPRAVVKAEPYLVVGVVRNAATGRYIEGALGPPCPAPTAAFRVMAP